MTSFCKYKEKGIPIKLLLYLHCWIRHCNNYIYHFAKRWSQFLATCVISDDNAMHAMAVNARKFNFLGKFEAKWATSSNLKALNYLLKTNCWYSKVRAHHYFPVQERSRFVRMIASQIKLWQQMNWDKHNTWKQFNLIQQRVRKRVSHIFRRPGLKWKKVIFPTSGDIPDSRRETVTNAVRVASVVTPPLQDKRQTQSILNRFCKKLTQ